MRHRITIIDDDSKPVVARLGNGRVSVHLGPVEHTGTLETQLATFSDVRGQLEGMVVDELLGSLPVQVERPEPASTVEHLRTIATATDPTAGAIAEVLSLGWHGVMVDADHDHGFSLRAIRSGPIDAGLSVLPYRREGVGLGQRQDFMVMQAYGATPALAVQAAAVMARAFPAPAEAVA